MIILWANITMGSVYLSFLFPSELNYLITQDRCQFQFVHGVVFYEYCHYGHLAIQHINILQNIRVESISFHLHSNL